MLGVIFEYVGGDATGGDSNMLGGIFLHVGYFVFVSALQLPALRVSPQRLVEPINA